MKSNSTFSFAFNLAMAAGETLKPTSMTFLDGKAAHKTAEAEPFKYLADGLAGLTGFLLNNYLKSPVKNSQWNYSEALELWKNLDPHKELYDRSWPRAQALRSEMAVISPDIIEKFETHFEEILESAMKPQGFDLVALGQLVDAIAWLENKTESALLYNFKINFSKAFQEKLLMAFSFLYHIRSLVALDHNAHIEDPSHEGVKIDAISDYLPRAEYVVNDAILYSQFKKLAMPFENPKTGKGPVKQLLTEPLRKSFQKYSHHAVHLIDQLPESFVSELNPVELEEALYLVQMDWLLGTPAGILFKIREELFGIQQGYERIFWKDVEPLHHSRPVNLTVGCHLSSAKVSAA